MVRSQAYDSGDGKLNHAMVGHYFGSNNLQAHLNESSPPFRQVRMLSMRSKDHVCPKSCTFSVTVRIIQTCFRIIEILNSYFESGLSTVGMFAL
jgi:hypothetical protein